MSLNLVEGAWTMYIHNCSHHRPSDYHRTVLLMTVKEAVFMKLKHEVFFKHNVYICAWCTEKAFVSDMCMSIYTQSASNFSNVLDKDGALASSNLQECSFAFWFSVSYKCSATLFLP